MPGRKLGAGSAVGVLQLGFSAVVFHVVKEGELSEIVRQLLRRASLVMVALGVQWALALMRGPVSRRVVTAEPLSASVRTYP